VLGPEHLFTAGGLSGLACCIQAQDDLAAARPLFERALAINEKVLGPEHVNTNRVRRNFATLLLASGDASQALASLRKFCATRLSLPFLAVKGLPMQPD
jgi:hypothetical protein